MMSLSAIEPRRRLTELLRAILTDSGDRAHARRGAIIAFAIRISSAALAYVSQVLLARWMGAHEYGIFAYCWVWLTILGILAPIGLNTSVLRFLPEYLKHGRLLLYRGLIRGGRLLTLAVSTITALGGAFVVYLTDGLIDESYAVPLYLTMICLPLFALTDVNEGIARAHSWVDLALLPPYILRPLLLLVFLAVALAAGAEANATTAVTAAIAATWLPALGQLLFLDRRLGIPAGAERAFALRHWIKISVPILLVESFFVMLSNTDVLVLNIYRGPADAAMYYAALKTTTLISFIYYSVTTVFAHRISQYNAAGDHEGLARVLRDAVTWTFWPSLAAACLILALGWPLLWLFGEAFTAAYPVMFVLVIGMLARAAVGPIEYMLAMLGEEKACAAVLALAAVANLGLNFLLIPDFGLMGAAAATAASTIVATFLLYRLAKRRLGLSSIIWTPRRKG